MKDLHKSSVLVFVHCGSLKVLPHASTALSPVLTALSHMSTRMRQQHCHLC